MRNQEQQSERERFVSRNGFQQRRGQSISTYAPKWLICDPLSPCRHMDAHLEPPSCISTSTHTTLPPSRMMEKVHLLANKNTTGYIQKKQIIFHFVYVLECQPPSPLYKNVCFCLTRLSPSSHTKWMGPKLKKKRYC